MREGTTIPGLDFKVSSLKMAKALCMLWDTGRKGFLRQETLSSVFRLTLPSS